MVHLAEIAVPYKRTGKPNGRPRKTATIEVDGKIRPNLTPGEWSSLRVELELLGDQNFSNWPGNVPLAQVADRCGVSMMAISKRRKKPAYRSGLGYLLAQELTERLSREDEVAAKRARETFPQPLSDQEREYALWQSKPQWPRGGLRSPFNGQFYSEWDDYLEHLKKVRAAPWRKPKGTKP